MGGETFVFSSGVCLCCSTSPAQQWIHLSSCRSCENECSPWMSLPTLFLALTLTWYICCPSYFIQLGCLCEAVTLCFPDRVSTSPRAMPGWPSWLVLQALQVRPSSSSSSWFTPSLLTAGSLSFHPASSQTLHSFVFIASTHCTFASSHSVSALRDT